MKFTGTGSGGLVVAVALAVATMLGTAQAAVQGVERVSVSSTEVTANDNVRSDLRPAVSADGRFIAFSSRALNLDTDGNNAEDIFLRDRQTGTTALVSRNASGQQSNGHSRFPALSADGRFLVFSSLASNLVAGDTNEVEDIFWRDLQTGETRRVSLRSDGAQVPPGIPGTSDIAYVAISGDGQVVGFQHGKDLIGPDFTRQGGGCYVHDVGAGTMEQVSIKSNGDPASLGRGCSLSHDGSVVAWASSDTNVVPGDTSFEDDVFVRDRDAGTTEWMNPPLGEDAEPGRARHPEISPDGRFVVYESTHPDLVAGDTNNASDIFLRDRQTDTTTRVSLGAAVAQGNGASSRPTLSEDGRLIAFVSDATNLVGGDTNSQPDIFLRDRQAGTTERLSVTTGGQQASGFTTNPVFSSEGTLVAFPSFANLTTPNTTAAQLYAAILGNAPANRPPTANAGRDRTVKSKAKTVKVALNASASTDPDGDRLTFRWLKGETQLATGPKPKIKLKRGVHTLTLEARDPGGLTDTDEVVITIKKKGG